MGGRITRDTKHTSIHLVFPPSVSVPQGSLFSLSRHHTVLILILAAASSPTSPHPTRPCQLPCGGRWSWPCLAITKKLTLPGKFNLNLTGVELLEKASGDTIQLEMHLSPKLDSPDFRAEVLCRTPLPWVAWDVPLLLWGRTRSLRESGQNRMRTTHSVSLEQLPNTSPSPQPGLAGELWLQDNPGGLAARRRLRRHHRQLPARLNTSGDARALWESPWDHWEGTARHRVLQERYPVPPAKHAQALNSTCPQHLPGRDLCLEGSPLARL